MRFGFDESGDFGIPRGLVTSASAVVAGVAYPDSAEAHLREILSEFAVRVGRQGSEVKGRFLNVDQCMDFIQAVRNQRSLLIEPASLDLTWITDEHAADIPERVCRVLYSKGAKCVHESMRAELELLGRQFRNLSPQQALRVILLSRCINQVARDAVIFVDSTDDDVWADVRFEIDAVQARPNSREARLFRWILLGWLTAWSKVDPWKLIDEIHTSEHSFVKHYESGSVLEFGRLFRDNIFWVDSRQSTAVQLADVSAAITRRAMMDVNNVEGWSDVFAELSACNPRSPEDVLGLITFDDLMPEEVRLKYGTIVRRVASHRTAKRPVHRR
ncbi:MAG: hypothetical protein C4547_01810 [Phycisphaerales bacterium]|nr:MAG: hypothetical protein C4547_01810 [Phycisphaerales bacterium]